MRLSTSAFLLACGALTAQIRVADAQSVHMPPPHMATIQPGRELLRISPKHNDYNGLTVAVSKGQLMLSRPGTLPETYSLSGRTLLDVMTEIEARHKDKIEIQAAYDYWDAELLGEVEEPIPMPTVGSWATLTSKKPEPVVMLGFGAILSMAQEASQERSGILGQTGFNLDLAGTHQVATYSASKRKGWYPSIYVTGRIGLMSDQDLVVQKEESAALMSPSEQAGEAIRQADQIALTAQIDNVWRLWSQHQELGVYLGAGRVYAQPEAREMPMILLKDSTRVTAESVFGAASVAKARSETARSIPLAEYNLGATFRFLKRDGMAFYIGAGYQIRGVPRQAFGYRRNADKSIDTLSLRGSISSQFGSFSQFMIGIRLPGIVEIRADANSPIKLPDLDFIPTSLTRPNSAPAVLRLVITRPFPITK